MPRNLYPKRPALLILLILFSRLAFSQLGCPPNIDFENGTLDGWECFRGKTSVNLGKNVISLTPSSAQSNYHELISDPNAKDPYGNFPQLCPYGGKYSVKLGNNSSGSEAEGISYTFVVPSTVDTFTFTYFYAVVFQNPGHDHTQQPRFFVTAYDVLTGDLINCASYDYVSTSSLPGFKVSPVASDVLYKNWSPVSIQFAGLANRSVRLEFKTADCTLGGHFGYSYLDVGTGCSNILATAPYCIETNSVLLNAPYGFQTYTWWNADYSAIIGTEQSLTFSPPPVTEGRYFVDLIPYPGFGCRDTAYADVTPLPVPDMPVAKSDYFFCQRAFTQALQATAQPGSDLLWYAAAAGGTGNTDPTIPPTSAAGDFTYYVTQKILFGCESLRKEIKVRVIPVPVTSFTINDIRQCQDNNDFVFTSTSTNLSNSQLTWDFGDGSSTTTTGNAVSHTYTSFGPLNVKLKVLNETVCGTELSKPVTIIPKPKADFSFPAVICEAQTQLPLKNISTVPSSLSRLSKWWWSVAGTTSILQEPAAFVPKVPGPMEVKLVVITDEGCASDTVAKTIPVHYRPDATFVLTNQFLCDNETVLFNNTSSLPVASFPENIVIWNWKLDNSATYSVKHPALRLPEGIHRAKLDVETNFGCKSNETELVFDVKRKPNVSVDVTDSCIHRLIYFRGNDHDLSVVNWKWDLGNGAGFKDGRETVSRNFSKEGDNSFTLITRTGDGCKDTIYRPYYVYDNKARAGVDTIVAKGEPLQLDARGGTGVTYVWSPAEGLNDASKENPVALLDRDILYRLDAMTDKGCDSHSQIFVKRYIGPRLYIPNGFTPNSDGVNDTLHVFPVGIKKFLYFAIYSRNGQKLYETFDYKKGWDGTFRGNRMDNGTYVAVSSAVDYRGNTMLEKEAVILSR